MTDDLLNIWINRDDAEIRGAEGFRPILEHLERSFLDRPEMLEETAGRTRPIAGCLDPAVLKALDRGGRSVVLQGGDGLWVDFLQFRMGTTVSLRFRPAVPPDEIKALFVDLVEIVSPTYARAHLDRAAQRLHAEHYQGHERTFYADGLYWLNYFGPDELARQGGETLAENPYATVSRVGDGLLLEVGDGPEDAVTPEGEQRLVAATRCMPPLGGEARPEDEPEPAELVTIGGVRGFLDPVDNGFWVTKHVGGGGKLDAATVRGLGALPGQGDPPVGRVHVLFSTQEAADANREALAGVSAETWYVDPESGQPRPA